MARAILEIAERTAAKHPGTRAARVHVVVGPFAHIDVATLRLAFDALRVGTSSRDASLVIERKLLFGACRECGGSCEADAPDASCPACGGSDLLWSGDEGTYVTAIDLVEETGEPGGTSLEPDRPAGVSPNAPLC
jgi:hydrogenase nickel incorporation protein HypA/HybF